MLTSPDPQDSEPEDSTRPCKRLRNADEGELEDGEGIEPSDKEEGSLEGHGDEDEDPDSGESDDEGLVDIRTYSIAIKSL